ncbi:MAG: GTP cyclohydrolase I [Myxococcota bacterium]|nr:GTP cyclohydrolase I [Myxococcota bacterium]
MASKKDSTPKLTKAIEDFLRAVGRSPGTYPELIETPVRTANMWMNELLDGYAWDPKDILVGGASTTLGDDGLVIVRDMFFHSVCPHHLLPFHGVAHVGYIPGPRIVGLSKIARLVDCFAHRLTLQEEIGHGITGALITHLGAKGAACLLDAEQLCMVIRGVRKPGSRAVTASYAGALLTDKASRTEFLSAINAEE